MTPTHRSLSVLLVAGAALAGCKRQPTFDRDASLPPLTPEGAELASFDRLVGDAGPALDPRVRARLGASKPFTKQALYEPNLSATSGTLAHAGRPTAPRFELSWELRDDILFGRRYLTAAKVRFAGNRCAVTKTDFLPPDDDHVLVNTTFTCESVGAPTSGSIAFPLWSTGPGNVRPDAGADGDGSLPARVRISFTPSTGNVEDPKNVLDVLSASTRADEALQLCLVIGGKVSASTRKHEASLRQALVARGIAANRVVASSYRERPPPDDDDAEIWPYVNDFHRCRDPRER